MFTFDENLAVDRGTATIYMIPIFKIANYLAASSIPISSNNLLIWKLH